MSFLSPDTSPQAAARQVEILRAMGPQRRLRRVFELNAVGRKLLESGVRLRHPDWSDHQVKREAIRLRLGDELFQRTFGTGSLHLMDESSLLNKLVQLLDKALQSDRTEQ